MSHFFIFLFCDEVSKDTGKKRRVRNKCHFRAANLLSLYQVYGKCNLFRVDSRSVAVHVCCSTEISSSKIFASSPWRTTPRLSSLTSDSVLTWKRSNWGMTSWGRGRLWLQRCCRGRITPKRATCKCLVCPRSICGGLIAKPLYSWWVFFPALPRLASLLPAELLGVEKSVGGIIKISIKIFHTLARSFRPVRAE